jgi:two-component system OmpR family response regulator
MTKEETKPHLLLVEDAGDIREPLARYLREHEFRVTTAADASVARHVMKSAAIDLIVLDIMMPGEDGISLCRAVWETSQIPVILLTARGEEQDRIIGLEIGAADYVPKPFSPRELLARINAVLRRTTAMPPNPGLPPGMYVRFGGWTLDTGLGALTRGDEEASLTDGEFRVLLALLGRPKVALTRAQLGDHLGLRDDAQSGRSIDNYVSRLRKKLEIDPAKPVFIKTLWGGGYIFAVEPTNEILDN